MSSWEVRRGSPYQGLVPYGEADAPFFFGREKETRLITANLFASPLTLLYGASGVGKSSVLRAGVAHQLRERDDLLVVVFNDWQGYPVSHLIESISVEADHADENAWKRAWKEMGRAESLLPKNQRLSLAEFLAICATHLNRRLMIILDQFEEYFLYHPQEDEFAAEFSKAVTQSNAPVSFLISIREDFYARLDRFEGRIPSLYDNYLRIEHLDRAAALSAIEKPIAEYNRQHAANPQINIEPELTAEVLKQVRTGAVTYEESGQGGLQRSPAAENEVQIETPFLQLVMTRLWNEDTADSRTLKLATFQRLGGAASIVRQHLGHAMDKLPTDGQDTAATIFRYLVTPSGTKIAYNASDLAATAEVDPGPVEKVLQELSQGEVRILRSVDPSVARPDEPRYEIFHDVLGPAVLDWRTRRIRAQLILKNLNHSLNELNELEREIAARILSSLITAEHTRGWSLSENLASAAALPVERVRPVIDRLSTMAILRAETSQGATWYELAHDQMIEPIEDWLKSLRHINVNYLGRTGTQLLSGYFILLSLVLAYSLYRFWPATASMTEPLLAKPVVFLFWHFSISDGSRLVVIAMLAGALGSHLQAMRSLASYVGNHMLATRWLPKLLCLPLIGAFLALAFYSFILTGFLTSAATAGLINPFGVAAAAGLIGLFSSQVTNRLTDIFLTLFKAPGDNDRRAQKEDG